MSWPASGSGLPRDDAEEEDGEEQDQQQQEGHAESRAQVVAQPAHDGGQQGLRPIRMIHRDGIRGATGLLRLAKGARYPADLCPGGEEIFVVKGDMRVGVSRLRAGDFLVTPPGGSLSSIDHPRRVR